MKLIRAFKHSLIEHEYTIKNQLNWTGFRSPATLTRTGDAQHQLPSVRELTFYFPQSEIPAGQSDERFLLLLKPSLTRWKHKKTSSILNWFSLARQRPTLTGAWAPTTIGAEELNFRVRNGNGCGLFAIITGLYEEWESFFQNWIMSYLQSVRVVLG